MEVSRLVKRKRFLINYNVLRIIVSWIDWSHDCWWLFVKIHTIQFNQFSQDKKIVKNQLVIGDNWNKYPFNV